MIPYIGGKYNQSKWMEENSPLEFNEYGEVFGGAMWFYIRSNFIPYKSYYNDIDPLMVNLFSCLKEYNTFINRIESLPTYDDITFNKMKEIIQSNENFKIPNIDLAIAHVYVITHIFSGFTKDIWRKNLKMVKRRPNSPIYMKDHAIFKRLKNKNIQKKIDVMEVSNETYDNFLKRVDKEDLFLYIDPPYWKTETHYRHGWFNEEDHIKMMKMLKNMKCKWMLSYYDFDIIHEYFPENEYIWKRKKYKKASGNVKKGSNKSTDEEILIMNYGNSINKNDNLIDKFFG